MHDRIEVFLGFPHVDQVLVRDPACRGEEKLKDEPAGRDDGKEQDGRIVPGLAHPHDRRGRCHADPGLLQRTAEDQPSDVEHQDMRQDEADQPSSARQPHDQGVDAQVPALEQRDDRADEDQPDEEQPRQLFRYHDARIEGVAQRDIAEHKNEHHCHADSDKCLQWPDQQALSGGHGFLSLSFRFHLGRASAP